MAWASLGAVGLYEDLAFTLQGPGSLGLYEPMLTLRLQRDHERWT